jgi:thiamine transport system substrate-binding protein
MKRLLALAASVVALSVLAACGSDGGSDGSSSDEPTTVVLLTHNAFTPSEDVLAEFTKQTGYKVRPLAPGDAGIAVNTAILRKDDQVADVLYGVDNTFLTRALDAGIFEPYEARDLDEVPTELVTDSQHRVTPIDYGDVCLNYDTTWFGRDGHPPAPTSLDDLIKPEYKNLTVVENPSSASPGLAFMLATIEEYGEEWHDYWRDLRANGVRVAPDWTQAYTVDFTQGGGNGDRPIVVSYASSPPADVVYADPPKDEPSIGVVEESCFRQIEYAGVLRGARNEKGARALVDFLLSRRFQEDMPLTMFVFPARSDAVLPEVFTKWAARPEDPATMTAEKIGEHRDEWIKEWTDIVVR